MDKNMEEKIRVVANYIVDNKATIIKTAEHFNMSPSSIKKYINSKDKLQSIDIELFKKVKETLMGITLVGQIDHINKEKKLQKYILIIFYSFFNTLIFC